MTGLGTSESPFKIENLEDFLSMGETGSPTAYYELADDINFDGEGNKYLHENPHITLNCVSLDGKGHKIRNLMLMHPNENLRIFVPAEGVVSVTITNLGFENMNLSGLAVSVFYGDSCTYRLYKCDFSMFVKTDQFSNGTTGILNSSERAVMMCDSCTFIMRADYSISPAPMVIGKLSNGSYVRNCQFKLDGNLLKNYTLTATGSFFKTIELTNVFLEGHVRVLNRDPEKDSCFPLANNCKISNIFLMLGGTNVDKISIGGTGLGGEILSPCVYNLDAVGDAEYADPNTSLSPRMYGLTDEECKNAEKLREIGFVFEEAGT